MAGSGLGGFGSGVPSNNGARGTTLDIEVKGLQKLLGRFKTYEAGLKTSGPALANEVAEDIAVVARDLVAIDTGRVQEHIEVRKIRGGAEVYAYRGGERDEVPAYLELGTFKMAARPFLKPAGRMVLQARGVEAASRRIGGLLAPTGKRSFG